MGYWKCDDGTKVEIIFDEQGEFIKFGDDATKEDIEKAKQEIIEANKNL